MNPVEQFENAINQHFKPMAVRLTLRYRNFDDHLFIMYAPDISVHVYFFEQFSTPGYDVVVGIAPKEEFVWNPSGERGLGWLTKYLGISGMPEDRIGSVSEIASRVQLMSQFTDNVLARVFSTGPEFWPPFYAFVQAETAKIPEPAWMKDYKKS